LLAAHRQCDEIRTTSAGIVLQQVCDSGIMSISPFRHRISMSSALFSAISLGPIALPNRIVVAPMCQYSAEDGNVGDWHAVHLGGLAKSGAGLVIIEATAVEPIGRITPWDVGLYNDDNEKAMARVLEICAKAGNARFGIQLAHAGRKASTDVPWRGGRPLTPEQRPWEAVAPSAIPFADGWPAPHACTIDDLHRIRDAFAASAKRAARIGIEVIELHLSHGYLLHEFFSPHANKRDDIYGGSLENRMRFLLEVFSAVREACPPNVVVGARISGGDWIDSGAGIEDCIALAQALEARGCGFVDVTTGGIDPKAKMLIAPNYQVPHAEQVKRHVKIPVCAVGLIVQPRQAEEIVKSGRADMVALARAFLDNPHWPMLAAQELGAEIAYPPQYARAHPSLWPGANYR
jgi:2,4-dienoyl-CoA reductase-like NADH-dependent reductase (Old Yellow Enzyme family)